jgi:hypothetical protein
MSTSRTSSIGHTRTVIPVPGRAGRATTDTPRTTESPAGSRTASDGWPDAWRATVSTAAASSATTSCSWLLRNRSVVTP